MTDTLFYDELAALATELMNDFGTPATLRKVTKGPIGADGKATVETEDHPGLAVRISDTEMLRILELEGDTVYCLKFPIEPEAGYLLLHQGQTFELYKGKKINPEGNRLMVSFHGVKDV